MLSENQIVDMMKRINFGDIDGYGDPNLDQYFLDNDYWDKVVNEDYFFISGRKGTGKSAIYRMIEEQSLQRGVIVHNTDFGSFPFNRLLGLSDDDFSKPNQYQSIWRYLILVDFAKLVANNPIPGDELNIHYQAIDEFVSKCLGTSIADLYKETISNTSKTDFGLTTNYLGIGVGLERTQNYNLANCRDIVELNGKLQESLINYFMTCGEERKIVIQFDRLDDNYNALQRIDDYLCAIASLLKYSYSFNQEMRRKDIHSAKVIVYLRKDIIREISKIDAESARWEPFIYNIDWAVNNTHQYQTSELYAMINKRISASIPGVDFDQLFDTSMINLRYNSDKDPIEVFRYVIDRTMHRPRDVIQFCKKIQDEIIRTNRVSFRSVKSAEREYCTWLVYDELENEINPIITNINDLYQMLRELGQHSFPLNDFYKVSRSFCENEEKLKTPSELARALYDVGILMNINTTFAGTKRRTSFRNEGPLDKNMRVMIHPGVWKGITD